MCVMCSIIDIILEAMHELQAAKSFYAVASAYNKNSH